MHELALLNLIDAYPGLDPHWVETNRSNAGTALADVPPRYQDATIDGEAAPGVLAWATELCHTAAATARAFNPRVSTGRSLLVLGPVGTGKTHQAYGAIRQIVHTGVAVSWLATTAADMYAEARLRPRDWGRNEDAHGITPVNRYMRIPLLLLDDLGAAKASEWTEEITYRVINYRYEQELPTIVTSNLGVPELRDGLGERVASRLREMAIRVPLKGDDRRRPLRSAG
jgi:DNA replication protein DnaC